MSVSVETEESREHDYSHYRALSMTAVTALVLGVVSLPALYFPFLLIVPFVGIVIASTAFRILRRNSFELTGMGFARIGMLLCVFNLVGGSAKAAFVYMTEVPEGYLRISFRELQPDDSRPDLPVSSRALELHGKKIFVKGYIYPDDRNAKLKKFVLVPDMGTCCFGGQPKLTDMIEVKLRNHPGVKFSYQRRKLAGVLKVDTALKEISGLQGVYYQLEADLIQ